MYDFNIWHFFIYWVSVQEPKMRPSDRWSLVLLCDLKYLMSLKRYLTMSGPVVIIRLHRQLWCVSSATQQKKKSLWTLRNDCLWRQNGNLTTVNLSEEDHKAWNTYCVYKRISPTLFVAVCDITTLYIASFILLLCNRRINVLILQLNAI